MPKTGNRGRARRLGTYLTSLVLLAAQLLFFGHLALVRHVACPQHGDVIHSPGAHEGLQDGLDHQPLTREPVTGSTPNVECGHDHCLICTSSRERYALLPPARHGIVAPKLAVPFLPSSDADALVPVAPIVYSPKSSPPTG